MPHLPNLLQMVPHPFDPWYHTMTWGPDQVQDEAVPNLCARLRLTSTETLTRVLDYFQTHGLSMDNDIGSLRYYEEAVPAALNRGQQRERELALVPLPRRREVPADEQARHQPVFTRRRVRSPIRPALSSQVPPSVPINERPPLQQPQLHVQSISRTGPSSTSTQSRRNRTRLSRSSLPQPNDGSDMD